MTKTTSLVIICIICAITLFFCVCSCLPGGLKYGEFDDYNSAINLFQGSSLFNDSIVATYKVKDVDQVGSVVASVRSRLGKMYGRWFSSVTEKDGIITVKVPKSVIPTDVGAETILATVTAVGKVEILKSATYSEDDVILTSEHIKSTRVRHYSNGQNPYYIVNLNLTKEGKAIAAENLTESTSNWSAYLAIDGTVSYGIAYTSGGLQVYASSDAQCDSIRGLIKSGALGTTLTQIDATEVTCNGNLIFAIVCAVLVVASWIFYAVRYKTAAVGAILAQLIAITAFIMFSGLVYFNFLNIASAIGILLGYGLMSCFTCITLGKIRSGVAEGKTYASARYKAFLECNKWNCIVHAIVLVVGIALWLIPTGVTAPLGNALVYWAVLSFGVTMGLNRLFTSLVAPFALESRA